MKIQKLVLGVTTLVAGSLLLTACSNNSTSSNASDKKVTLTIATWAGSDEQKQFDAILTKLNTASKDYTVKQMVIPGADYYTKIQTMIAGQTAPDLMWLSQEYVPAYAQKGALVDISDYIKSQKTLDLSDFYSTAMDTAKFDGKTYGLPWIDQPYMVYYNQALFQSAGLSAPSSTWTWSDFESDATAMTKNGVYGYANDGTLPLEVPIWGEGGDVWNSTKGLINSAEAVKGLQVLSDISTNSKMSMPYAQATSSGAEQAFVQGKVAMVIGGANDNVEQQVQQAGGKFTVGMASMPAGSQKQVTFSYIASTMISSQTKNKAVAEEALTDITKAMFDWKVPAPVKSKFDTISTVTPDKKYAVDAIKHSMEISRGFTNLPQSADLNNTLWNSLWLPVISNNNGKGGVDLQSLANKANTAFNATLSKK